MTDPSQRTLRWRLWRPRSHWVLLALVLVVLGGLLAAHGYTRNEGGPASTEARDSAPAPELEGAGPVVDFSSPEPRAVPAPPGTVALTFDDGPDPRWTPRVLEILRRRDVPATFFVTGARAARHPGLVRRARREGHDIGVHTFSHADLTRLPGWRANLELSLSQLVLAGSAGVHTSLLRLPYSSEPHELTGPQVEAARGAARQGYLVVLADRDGRDWERRDPDGIVDAALPPDGRGAVVLLHDGGGDRAPTLSALDRLVPELKARGYRFTTVTHLAGLRARDTLATVGPLERAQGLGLLLALWATSVLPLAFAVLAGVVTALSVARVLVLLGFARVHARRRAHPDPDFAPPVSVVVPAYNEEVGIASTVRSLACGNYPEVEVVVVDDGSTDGTAEEVVTLGLANVVIVRQDNTGKPGALNAGLERSTHDVVVTVDGDTVFEPDTLRHLVQPFTDPAVGAVSGNTKVGNRRSLLGLWQHIEYVMGFNLDRRLLDVLGCIPTVPGAIGAFSRQALDDVGGFSADTLAEDTDVTMALNRAGWRVVYEEQARAWTEAPATMGGLWRQRYRWCYGTMQCIWKHRGAIRHRQGRLGRVGLPYLLLFQVVLPLLGPVFDLFALYGLLFLDPLTIGAYWLGFNVANLVVAAYAFDLDHEGWGPLWLLPLQQFVYRQVMYAVVIQSAISAVVGTRLRWHKLRRTGLEAPVPA